MPEDTSPSFESSIPKVELPVGGFKSSIPEALLEGADDGTKYMFEKASELSSFASWAAPILVDLNKQARRTNGRVNQLEERIQLIENNEIYHLREDVGTFKKELKTLKPFTIFLAIVKNRWGFMAFVILMVVLGFIVYPALLKTWPAWLPEFAKTLFGLSS